MPAGKRVSGLCMAGGDLPNAADIAACHPDPVVAEALLAGTCYCGPPVFSEKALYQVCYLCILAGCRFREPCRISEWHHPAPDWAVP